MKLLKFIHKSTPRLPSILQDEVAECGHACVVMLSRYYGHKLDMHALRKISQPSARGINILQIINILEKLKFTTRPLRVPLEGIKFIQTPAILHWNLNHFVVLKKVTRNKIIIHDPAVGICKYSYAEFSKHFTGIALEVKRSTEFASLQTENKLTLLRIIKSTPLIKKSLGFLMMITCGLEVLNLLNPLLLQYITDNVLGTNSYNNLYTIAIGFTLLIIIKLVAEYARENLVLFTTTNFAEAFNSGVFKHLLSLPISFFTSRHQGDIQSKFQAINQIKTKISSDFVNTLFDGIMFILTLGVMLIYSVPLTLVVTAAVLIFLGLRYFSYQQLKSHSATAVYLNAKLASQFLETLRAITPIKIYRKEKQRFTTWHNSYIETLNAEISVAKQQILYKITNHFLFHLEHILVICIGASLVIKNKISIGMFLAFLAYRQMLVDKSSSLIQNVFDYQLLGIHLNRISDIVLQAPVQADIHAITNNSTIQSLKLENICFTYDESEPPIFKDFNFEISKGEKVAIIGESGCGKSTLLKIMLGLVTIESGNILINNLPLNTFGMNNYKDKIAAVMQEDHLLSGSIIDNITFFEDNVDLQEVYHAADLAQIHSTISQLPMGYETLLGDMGSVLSGGQKQRLLLARALYKKPEILFLDEASSHLDKNNEQNINKNLKDIQITQIIVAHRQETINMADRVIKLG